MLVIEIERRAMIFSELCNLDFTYLFIYFLVAYLQVTKNKSSFIFLAL